MRRPVAAVVVAIILVVAVAVGVGAANMVLGPGTSPTPGTALVSPSPGSIPSPEPSATSTPAATPDPTPEPTPTPEPSPTPKPTPVLVPAPLTGMPVTPAVAKRHVVAVMIDDLWAARPQSGLSQASIVWQAPAEGGIPRYMALFQETAPKSVGPVRSSRLYFIAWASQWRAVYMHVGGSPQALALLHSARGKGKVVYDADEFRYGPRYMYRIRTRSAPHNVYSDAKKVRALVKVVGAKPMDYQAAWSFAPDAPLAERPKGSSITVPYLANKISYAYDRKTNRWMRSVSVEGKQVDAGTKQRIGPKNVVIMFVRFAPLNDGSREAPPGGPVHRLRRGLDRDERQGRQGHVEEELDDRSGPAVHEGRQAGDADDGPDVRAGGPDRNDGEDHQRQGAGSCTVRGPGQPKPKLTGRPAGGLR